MKSSTIAGLGLIAGVAVVEVALVPVLLIGAAALYAPKYSAGARRVLRKRSRALGLAVRPSKPVGTTTASSMAGLPGTTSAPFEVRQAIFKTITFRVIATSFDFTANMVVIGNFTTAAGLSAFGLIGAPLFYFCHEVFWNRLAPAGTRVEVGKFLLGSKTWPLTDGYGLTMNRAFVKTVTYEIITITVDFGANYVATGDLAVAGGLTLFAAVISPFIYFGHEKLWEHFSSAGSSNQKQLIMTPVRPARLMS